MKLLLDTHAFLWLIQGDARLSKAAETAIQDPANEPHLSMVSLWEIAIKVSINKLNLAQPYSICMPRETLPFNILPITLEHTTVVATLPFQANHNDPFDRLLIAQAMVEQIPLVSNEAMFNAYPITRLW